MYIFYISSLASLTPPDSAVSSSVSEQCLVSSQGVELFRFRSVNDSKKITVTWDAPAKFQLSNHTLSNAGGGKEQVGEHITAHVR